jgi:hypothetical protein
MRRSNVESFYQPEGSSPTSDKKPYQPRPWERGEASSSKDAGEKPMPKEITQSSQEWQNHPIRNKSRADNKRNSLNK